MWDVCKQSRSREALAAFVLLLTATALFGAEPRSLEGHKDNVYALAFSPDGRTLLSASADNTAICWDLTKGQPLLVCKGHSGPVYGAAFSPDGKTIATGSGDKTVRLWDAKGKGKTLEGHEDGVYCVAFSPDGKTLASAGADNTIRLWDVATGATRQVLKGHQRTIYGLAFSPDGKTLASVPAIRQFGSGMSRKVRPA